jgi:hypothetical protein
MDKTYMGAAVATLVRKPAILFGLLSFAIVPLNAGLINGDFETGDRTGWTSFTTPTGTTSGISPVVTFPTSGVDSLAAHFSVALNSGAPGGTDYQGCGIYQDVVLA